MSILNLLDETASSLNGNFQAAQHLQKMIVFQQLAMEKVNDAMALATQSPTPINEAFIRPTATFLDEEAVRKIVLPALNEKAEILRLIENEQNKSDIPIENPFRAAFVNFNTVLEIMQMRTRLQIEGFEDWVNNIRDQVDVTDLDADELMAMDEALLSQNMSLQSLGLDADGFLDFLHHAFNEVRDYVGLAPMSNAEFRKLYIGGLEGKPARFFN